MRIVQIVHSFYPDSGGIETHVYELSKELAKRNEVVVYVPGNKREDEKVENFLVRRFPSFPSIITPKVRISAELFFELSRERADVYHSHGFFSPYPLVAALIAALKGKAFVFTFHGIPKPSEPLHALSMRAYEAFVAPIFLSFASSIITVSSLPGRFSRYSGRTSLVPNGIGSRFRCRSNFPSKRNITFVGRLSRDKNPEMLLRAFAKLKKTSRRLVFCGPDEGMTRRLIALAKELKTETKVVNEAYGNMTRIYCESNAIVLPSRYEGFPLIWGEAVACGRPVFSSKVGDYKKFFTDAYGKDANLFLFGSESELHAKLGNFLGNQKKFLAIVLKARKKITERYSWGRMARVTERLYLKKKEHL